MPNKINITISKIQIKLLFAAGAVVLAFGFSIYTQHFSDDLIYRDQQLVDYYAKVYKHYLTDPNCNMLDFFFFIENVNRMMPLPVIMTNELDEPIDNVHIKIDSNLSAEQKSVMLKKIAIDMGKEFPPICITDSSGKIINKIYYSRSEIIGELQLLPYLEVGIVALFIVLGYLSFSNIRRAEETKVWVGMAKEAAHQLGTPLSSMLGWIEILKMNSDDPDAVEDTIDEMSNDVERLNVIANRFSKIGSEPKLTRQFVGPIIEATCAYFERRLPHLGKRVEINRSLDNNVLAYINEDLFIWVIENLIKNAVEAIDEPRGFVNIKMAYNTRNNKIHITATDSGKGMSSQLKRQVFNPGFTTKKRGWGLGLSLAKRIIEEYHGGKIYVKESVIGEGTTFAIDLEAVKMGEV